MRFRILLLMCAAAAAQTPSTAPQVPVGALSLQKAPLTEVIDMFARKLGLSVLVDPGVKGSVTLTIDGEGRKLDARNVLEMLLRSNGAGMVEEGGIFHIVPLTDISHLPVPVWISWGADMGGGFRGCVQDDNSPAGTILNGYRKVVARTVMGPSCHWEQTK